MTRADVEAFAASASVELVLYDGHDDAIMGIGERLGDFFVVYDVERIIRKLMTRDGMTRDDAREFCDFNIAGSAIGDATPCLLQRTL